MYDDPTARGTCNARFEPLRELFAAKIESGEDLGTSLALNIDVEIVRSNTCLATDVVGMRHFTMAW